ncbi:Reverse transcriptase zinc-binding domain [Macleaya cordata]|uniref:Reverse transcriptase zinc-binding domain n=1 Tax=Macleaya cordata TaxID=56857 RepID=A0A200QRS3_MACCD|nr:Reverse transcriptase zinc-binding domain [Macleaya cordata]
MEVLDRFRRGQETHDTRVWSPDVKGIFSVKSLYYQVTKDQSPDFDCKKIWSAPVPHRVIFFIWEATLHRINTVDRLQWCGLTTCCLGCVGVFSSTS